VNDYAANEWQLRDFYLARWLVARNWNMDAACEMFINSMKWRKENNVDNIDEWAKDNKEFEEYNSYWPGRTTGTTKDGWDVVFESFGKVDPNSVLSHTSAELRTKYNIWRMEQVEKRRREKEDELGWSAGTTLVSDMSGLGFSHMSSASLEVFRQISTINKLNYPETLRRSYIINAPSIFHVIWKAVSIFLDPSTQEKTSVHGSDFLPGLLESMENTSIPENFGGQASSIPNGGSYAQYKKSPADGEFTAIDIGRSSKYDKKFVVKETTVISWEFTVVENDIGFCIFNEDENEALDEVVSFARYHGQDNCGSYTATRGTYVLRWDNSYSWTKSKTVKFKVQLTKSS